MVHIWSCFKEQTSWYVLSKASQSTTGSPQTKLFRTLKYPIDISSILNELKEYFPRLIFFAYVKLFFYILKLFFKSLRWVASIFYKAYLFYKYLDHVVKNRLKQITNWIINTVRYKKDDLKVQKYTENCKKYI